MVLKSKYLESPHVHRSGFSLAKAHLPPKLSDTKCPVHMVGYMRTHMSNTGHTMMFLT